MISDVNAGNLKIINQHIATLEKKTLSAARRKSISPNKAFVSIRESIYRLAKNLILFDEAPEMIACENQTIFSAAFKTKEDFENRFYSTFYHDFKEEIEYVVFAVSFLKDVHIPSETLVKLFDSCPYNHFGEFGGYHNGIYNAYGITFGNEKEWSLKGKAFYISVLFTHFEMCGTIPSPVFLDNRTRIFSLLEPDTKDNMIAATCAASSSPPLSETTKNEDEKMTNTNGTTPSVRDLFKIDRQKGPMGNLLSAFGAGTEIGAAGAMSGAATDFVLSRLSSGSPTAAALIKNTPFVRPVFDFVVPIFVYFIAYYSMFPGVSPETQAKFAQHALLAIVSHSDTVVAILGRDFLSSLTRHMLNAISEWEANPLGSERR
jgi:hypothetical protein